MTPDALSSSVKRSTATMFTVVAFEAACDSCTRADSSVRAARGCEIIWVVCIGELSNAAHHAASSVWLGVCSCCMYAAVAGRMRRVAMVIRSQYIGGIGESGGNAGGSCGDGGNVGDIIPGEIEFAACRRRPLFSSNSPSMVTTVAETLHTCASSQMVDAVTCSSCDAREALRASTSEREVTLMERPSVSVTAVLICPTE